MTDYVKIIDDLPQFPPKNKGSILNYDLDIDLLIQDGYKPFVPAEIPETIRMYHFEYTETDVIREVVVFDETQEEAEARIAEEEEKEFNRKFFNTSLGYVSRDVHMKNGTVKDFLTDILPLLQVGVPVLIYTRELEQNKVLATQQFIDECKQQLITDFYG